CEPNYLYTHSVNTCFLAADLALALNYPIKQMQTLVIAALFHDIGMMKIPLEIWNKESRLSSAEYEEVQKHPLYGEGFFSNVTQIDAVVPMVIGQHHERIDGTGYPGHLTKNEINVLARLLGLVDRYDTQTHARLWRDAIPPDETMQSILDKETNRYDSYFLKALLHQLTMFPVGCSVKLSSGEIGEVLRTNPDTPMRPVIKLTFDRDKNPITNGRVLDLSKQLLIYVEKCVVPSELETY
ncbi:MAG: HD domain-containing protein, partial [Candidatus Omnitrophica bacterium]|nr:HD domain-containing protein [Candidatus Omnitrophota bacterium]